MKHNKELTRLSQKLRREMTKEEKQLWYRFLRAYPVQFRRQVTCGQYILDFYCSKAKLEIELDGAYHGYSEIVKKDRVRTEYLDSIGICVLRFPNKEIWNDLDTVCRQIDYTVKKRLETGL
jgi:very-short-patch-repair endonuclease